MLFNSEKEHKKYMRKIYKLSELSYQYKLEKNNRFCILNRLNWKKIWKILLNCLFHLKIKKKFLSIKFIT